MNINNYLSKKYIKSLMNKKVELLNSNKKDNEEEEIEVEEEDVELDGEDD